MPSSTSSSRAPSGPWLLTFGLAAVLALGVLGGVEWSLREAGHVPSVVHDDVLWAMQRHRVYKRPFGRTPVVILGSSRISTGFDPPVFDEAYPDYTAVMLARPGAAPIQPLIDLADDEEFRGIVLISIMPYHLLKKKRKEQRSLVKAYRRITSNYGYLNTFADRRLANVFDDHLAFRSTFVDLDKWASAQLTGEEPPEPNYMRRHGDYSRSPDYRKLDIERHRAIRVRRTKKSYKNKHKPPSPKRFRKLVRFVEKQVKKIQARGGQVVFVRYITTGAVWKLDQKYYPRNEYWDRLAEMTSAKTIHFDDVEGMRGYDCPDRSHLNVTDTPAFTIALAQELERQGVISGPSGAF